MRTDDGARRKETRLCSHIDDGLGAHSRRPYGEKLSPSCCLRPRTPEQGTCRSRDSLCKSPSPKDALATLQAAAQDLTGTDGFAAAVSTGSSLNQQAALPPPEQQFIGAALQMPMGPGSAGRQAVLTSSPATALLGSQQQQQQQQQLQLLASSSLGQSATTLPGQQAFTSPQSMPSMTPSQQRAPALQEMSVAAAPIMGPSLQQVHKPLCARTFPCTGIFIPCKESPCASAMQA